jgi:hypothetical protein
MTLHLLVSPSHSNLHTSEVFRRYTVNTCEAVNVGIAIISTIDPRVILQLYLPTMFGMINNVVANGVLHGLWFDFSTNYEHYI